MQRFATTFAAALLVAGAASAQMKSGVGMPATSNPNVMIRPSTQQESLDLARRIPRDEAIKLVKANKAVFVDVRSKQQYDLGHIPGAINIPRSQLLTHISELPPKKLIITYCACVEKEHSSALAVLDLNNHGMKNAAALLGGWLSWQQAHLPSATAATPSRR